MCDKVSALFFEIFRASFAQLYAASNSSICILFSDINKIESVCYRWIPLDVSLFDKATRKVLIKAVIKYQYKVGTQTYHNDQAILDKVYDVNQDVAQEEVDERSEKYIKGKTIIVFYNPKNPSESVLIPGPRKDKPYSDLILGFLGVIIGAAIAVLSWMGIIG